MTLTRAASKETSRSGAFEEINFRSEWRRKTQSDRERRKGKKVRSYSQGNPPASSKSVYEPRKQFQ